MENKKDNSIIVVFTEGEMEKLDVNCEKLDMSRSEFMKTAVFDKIRNMENPDAITTSDIADASQQVIESMKYLLKSNQEDNIKTFEEAILKFKELIEIQKQNLDQLEKLFK